MHVYEWLQSLLSRIIMHGAEGALIELRFLLIELRFLLRMLD